MITVGICTYNEEKSIAKIIGDALSQISPNDEVIVVASGCTDNTVDIVYEFTQVDERVKLLVEDERNGKASAINIINDNARGHIIVQTDGDVTLEEDAIPNLIKRFEDPGVGAVSGHPIPVISRKNLFYDWTLMSYNKLHRVRQAEERVGDFWHLSGYLLAWRRGALSEVPFVKGAVDAWMGKIIKDNGWKIVYEPEAKVLVKAPNNTKDFIAQKARVRAGYAYLSSNSPRKMTKEILWFPKELLKTPFWRWHKFIISGFIYAYSWYKGKSMAKKDLSLNEIWKVPTSTK
jgi:cellulose synthase/poly-beta-1,6-N-acetylglucosamine synthase-like glycosyltransferase